MLFSERYKGALFDKEGNWTDTISSDVTFQCKQRLVEVMMEFDEPKTVRTSRYSSETKNCEIVRLIIEKFCHDFNYYSLSCFLDYCGRYNQEQISSLYTPFLFDLIEMQYEALSKKEKTDFKEKINSTFEEFNLPWLLADGKLIKIDSRQFEMDLKNKTASLMLELKDENTIFQSAYDDLMKSIEQYGKNEFSECVISACKSYESVLKIYLNIARGNANSLTSDFSKQIASNTNINGKGFSDNVLMSLPYIRNNVAAHGSGANESPISREIANLSINLACSLITFVVSEYSKKEAKKDE